MGGGGGGGGGEEEGERERGEGSVRERGGEVEGRKVEEEIEAGGGERVEGLYMWV